MRVRLFSLSALIVLAFTIAVPAKAQFQQPTDEELKMTTDPKAPGAAAVYLNVEEIANDPLHYETFYARIKVLTEKGKELATVEIPYLKGNFKITDIKARTIHPDGTVIPLAVKPEDLLISKSGDQQIGRKVFTLPSVEVGSILEYHYQLDYDDNIYSSPSWDIQRKYYVHKAHYQFTPQKNFQPGGRETTSMYLIDSKGRPVNSLIWWSRLPEGTVIKSDVGGHYTVDVTDVPPIPDEDWMPPIRGLQYKVFFYYKSASTAQEFWLSEAKDWSKDVDRFAEQSRTIHEAVAGIVAPGDSEEVKAQKIYKAVEALDNTDYSRKKSESELKQLKLKVAKHAEDTWKQKSGSSEDIALLYLAMARAAGLKAYAIKVVARDQGVFDVTYMSISQLDDTLILLAAGDKGFLLDPGEKLAPFETVNWRHAEAGGMRQSNQGAGFQITPAQAYAANSTIRTADITLDAHGAITHSDVRIIMSGQEALRWRQRSLRNDETEVKKQFDDEIGGLVPQGVEAHIDHFLGLDDPDTNLMAVVKMSGSLGTATAKRLMLPGFFFQAKGHTPFVTQEKRLEAVDMHFAARDIDKVTYHLSEGMTVEGAPADTTIPWTGHAAYQAKTVSEPGNVTVTRTLIRAFALAKPEEYQDLRGFYQKIASEDQQQLVLSLAPTAKGN
jgi:hypothetical protein